MKWLRISCAICCLIVPSFALDREAFTFTNYDLNLRIEPEQQRFAVRGKIRLRNDSNAPQKNVALQISSTLDWRSIRIGAEVAEFVSHEYTSDIDHTGALSEAIVTLPHEISPGGTVELEVGYEGVIPLDVTRLTRIGLPEDKARHTDWDHISKSFTAVRGIGYVVWYPVATEAANLSEGNAVAETLGRWNARFAQTTMSVILESTLDAPIFFTGTPDPALAGKQSGMLKIAVFNAANLGVSIPTFVIANYQKLAPNDQIAVEYLPGQEDAAKEYAEAATNIDPLPAIGRGSGSLQILALPDPEAASFVSQGMLLCPLKSPINNEAVLDIVYAKTRLAVLSPRPWIQEGLAHYAQASFVEDQAGRQAALSYLNAHRAPLVEAEKVKPGTSGGDISHSLINEPDDLYLQTKAIYAWWMLRDMLGNPSLGFLLNYHASDDKDGGYMQRVIEKETHRDLQWFFDDWVYRDRGLPDFRVDSVYPRAVVAGGYVVTVTIENLGEAGAEVPVILRLPEGEIIKRLEVRAKSKASVRIETAAVPLEVEVNDGSVPESDMTNNSLKVPSNAAKPRIE